MQTHSQGRDASTSIFSSQANLSGSFTRTCYGERMSDFFVSLRKVLGVKPSLAIHYDCDPGQDDVIAMMYALGSGRVDIRSISIVGGNADVQQCARNAQQILDLTGFSDIPIHVGAAQPLKRLLHSLPEVFGESGMDGADLPPPSRGPASQDAVAFMTRKPDMVMTPPGTILPFMNEVMPRVWLGTGPLTNLALAFQKDPALAQRIDRLIIMGGCVHPEQIHGQLGNFQVPETEGWAEYNFAVDPEAAKIVFQSGIRDIVLVGVNITRSVLFNHEVEAALRANGNRSSIVAANILSTVGPEDHIDYASCKVFPEDPVRGMHDVVAMAYLLNPNLFRLQTFPLTVVTEPAPAVAGQTLIDMDEPDHPNVKVVMDLDRPRFVRQMVRNLKRLP